MKLHYLTSWEENRLKYPFILFTYSSEGRPAFAALFWQKNPQDSKSNLVCLESTAPGCDPQFSKCSVPNWVGEMSKWTWVLARAFTRKDRVLKLIRLGLLFCLVSPSSREFSGHLHTWFSPRHFKPPPPLRHVHTQTQNTLFLSSAPQSPLLCLSFTLSVCLPPLPLSPSFFLCSVCS